MKLYRKKPVVVEAVRFDGSLPCALDIIGWSNGEVGIGNGTNQLAIETKEGVMTAELGDWIIKGVADEFYPCKPDIFKATYEEVTE